MKFKLISMLAGMSMVAFTFTPVVAEACSDSKTNAVSGTTLQPTTQQDNKQS